MFGLTKDNKAIDNKPKLKALTTGTFAGKTHKDFINQISGKENATNILFQSKVSKETKEKINIASLSKLKVISIGNRTPREFMQELALQYISGENEAVLNALRKYINDNKGEVEHVFWYMLLDCYQDMGQTEDFVKAAHAFAFKFNTSPPSWEQCAPTKEIGAGKVILILNDSIGTEHIQKFKSFFEAAKEKKFCRINLTNLQIETSDIIAIRALLSLLSNLRKSNIAAVITGEQPLMDFCFKCMYQSTSDAHVNMPILLEPTLYWLLYLEILQWKGGQDKFEQLSIEYAINFELSPPSWEPSDKIRLEDESSELASTIVLKEICNNSIIDIVAQIKKTAQIYDKIQIDCTKIKTADISAIGFILEQFNTISEQANTPNKHLTFINPSKMLEIVLNTLSDNCRIEILARKR